MRKKTLFVRIILMFLMTSSVVFGQVNSKPCFSTVPKKSDANVLKDFKNSATASPILQNNKGSKAWNLQFVYPVNVATGVHTDGNYFYVTMWNNDTIFRYDMSGNYVDGFVIPGMFGGKLDLAYDGNHFYGGIIDYTSGQLGSVIYEMDFINQTLIGTINTTSYVSEIAYDPVNDAFWIGDWNSDLILVNRYGTTLNTISYGNINLAQMIGAAYDNVLSGGPYLWVHAIGPSGSYQARIYQINIATKQLTGNMFDVQADLGTNATAGGLFISDDAVAGTYTIGGVVQNDAFFGYNLASTVQVSNDVGVIAMNSPQTGSNLGANETVEIVIQNFGTNPQSGFDVSYVINGGMPVTETVQTTINSNDTYVYSFQTTCDLSAPGYYSFTSYTSLSTDTEYSNDTIYSNVSNVVFSNNKVYCYNLLGGTVGPAYFYLNDPSIIYSISDQSSMDPVYCGTWGEGNKWYAITYLSNQFLTFDTITGARSIIGISNPSGGNENWTGLAFDYSTNTMFGMAYDGSFSVLYTIDVTTGTPTQIGTTSGLMINLACNVAGDLYSLNIYDDNLYSIDKITGAGTAIGYVGFDANYAQDMEFNRATNELYMAVFNIQVGNGEGQLRVADINTGMSSLIGVFQNGAEICGFAIPFSGTFEPEINVTPTSLVIHQPSTITSTNTQDSSKKTKSQNVSYNDNDYKKDELFVCFDKDVTGALAKNLIKTNGCSVIKKYEIVPNTYLISIDDGSDVVPKIKSIQNLNGVSYAEPNYILHAVQTIPNDQGFSGLYGMNNQGQTGGIPDADIDAPEAWDITTGSSSVIVGIIDSGTDLDHPDLVDNLWVNPGEIAGNGIDDDNNGYVDDIHGWDFAYDDNDPSDFDGHGTHVAGTIGAVGNNSIGVSGVCWNVKIMTLKFLDDQGDGFTSDAIDAVEYATNNGANLTNNSWGGGSYNITLKTAIQNSNMLFIAAAGNGGPDFIGDDTDLDPHYPSSYDCSNIISVASLDKNNNKAGSSNFGATSVDLGAYGVDILSTKPNNNTYITFDPPGQGLSLNYYGIISGTSMATPQVAGLAALIYSYVPNLSWSEVKDAIMNNVEPVASLSGITVTGGHINAFDALNSLSVQSSLMIQNLGTGNLTITSITSNKNWLSTTSYPQTPFTITPGNSQTVDVDVNWVLLGGTTQTGIVTINSDDQDEPSTDVAVTAVPDSVNTTLHISPVSQTVFTSTAFTTTVEIEQVQNLGGFELDIDYDETLLTANTVTLESFLGSTGRTVFPLANNIDTVNGLIEYAATTLGATPPGPDGDGILLTINWTSTSTLSIETTTDLLLQNVQLTQPNGTLIPATIQDASVTITPCYIHDFDCDCDVDIVDITMAAYCYGTSTGNPNYNPTYDLDSDGDIDIVDITMVAYDYGWTCTKKSSANKLGAVNDDVILGISSNEESLASDGSYEVEINSENINQLGAYEFALSYDPICVEVLNIERGDLLESTGRKLFPVEKSIDNVTGELRFAITTLGPEIKGASGSGTLMRITCKALSDDCLIPELTRAQLAQIDGEIIDYRLKEDNTEIENSEQTSMLDCYPNPFNEDMTIQYRVAEEARISFKVYDVIGKLIMEIEPVLREVGTYEETFLRMGLNTGLYFVFMEKNNIKSDSRKIIVK